MIARRPKVVVTGSFDDLRSRHIRFLEEAAKLGELTVLLWPDEVIRELEARQPRFPQEERLYFLRAIRHVNQVQLVSGAIREDALPGVAGLECAVWVIEESRDNAVKETFCASHGLQYHVLPDDKLCGFPDASIGQTDTPAGRKKVLVTGCYDWFHSGHVRFFEEVSAFGDLYVTVGHDANVRQLKGEGRPLFPQEERRYIVGSIRFVKKALVATGDGWVDAEPEMQWIKPDIYAVNEDGDRPEKRAYCYSHGIEYLVLQRRPAPGAAWTHQHRLARLLINPNQKTMIKTGVLNPQINSLLSRVRHTNTLVIADRGFPFWPMIETVDISLVDDVPTVLEVLRAIRPNFQIGRAWMAREFLKNNPPKTRTAFREALSGIAIAHEPHVQFKKRVPHAIGLIRTGDTVQYANIVLESA